MNERKQYSRERYLSKRDQILAQNREWRLENAGQVKTIGDRYRLKNSRLIKEKHKRWREANKEKIAGWGRKYRLENPEKIKETNRKFFLRSPKCRLAKLARTRVYNALRGFLKVAPTFELVGCTPAELWRHLESKFISGMTRENYGPVWHVDHIRPCASFDLTDPSQQRECFHYSNLQPLFAVDNLKKGDSFEFT